MAIYRIKFQGCSAGILKMEDTFYLEAANLEAALKQGQADSLRRLGIDAQLERIEAREVNSDLQVIGPPSELKFQSTCAEIRKKGSAKRRRH